MSFSHRDVVHRELQAASRGISSRLPLVTLDRQARTLRESGSLLSGGALSLETDRAPGEGPMPLRLIGVVEDVIFFGGGGNPGAGAQGEPKDHSVSSSSSSAP